MFLLQPPRQRTKAAITGEHRDGSARPGTINPFVRKKLHLHHHKASGNADDLEERAITNGEPYGVKRLSPVAPCIYRRNPR